MFCQWLQANTQFAANILLTDKVGFTKYGIVNLHNTHVWVFDNLHTTMEPRYQHQFSTNNVWVGTLGDQLQVL
jgi:hypothetical protein